MVGQGARATAQSHNHLLGVGDGGPQDACSAAGRRHRRPPRAGRGGARQAVAEAQRDATIEAKTAAEARADQAEECTRIADAERDHATAQAEAAEIARQQFLEQPASFFRDGDRLLRAEDVADLHQRGMLLTARAVSSAERAWLHQLLGHDEPVTARAETDPSMLEEPVSRPARR
jgi:hypothetical protein